MKNDIKQKVYRIIMLIIVVAALTFVITNIISYDNSRKYVISTNKDITLVQKIETSINSIKKILDERYLGDLNEDDLVEGAIRGMVAATGDVYTEYYSKNELENFTASTLGNFIGIGIYMQADKESERVTVISPIVGSPAEKAGIKPGDKIIKVDGIEYKAEDINEVSSHIRGEAGTEVIVTILRDDEIMDLKIIRDKIHLNYVTGELLEDNIGYISISTFDEECCKDFIAAYDELAAKRSRFFNNRFKKQWRWTNRRGSRHCRFSM